MLVADAMTPDPTTVAPDVHVLQALERLSTAHVRRMPVVDRSGALTGIVTAGDLNAATPRATTAISLYDLNDLLATLTVGDVMTPGPVTVQREAPIEDAAVLLERHRVSGLPVVENDALVGILTITDVLRAFIDVHGAAEGGIRLTVEVPDEPGVLASLAQQAAPGNITAVVTSAVAPGVTRRLVLRIQGEGSDGYAERLEAAGVRVLDARRFDP